MAGRVGVDVGDPCWAGRWVTPGEVLCVSMGWIFGSVGKEGSWIDLLISGMGGAVSVRVAGHGGTLLGGGPGGRGGRKGGGARGAPVRAGLWGRWVL